FLEVEIVDEDGNPLPGFAFQLSVPDGTTQKGRTPASGVIHVGDLEPGGSGQIEFGDDEGETEDADAAAAPEGDEPTYTINLIDDTGQPVEGATLEFSLDDEPATVTTDASGAATTQSTAASGTVKVLDLLGLQKSLKARWQEAPPSAQADSVQRVDLD